MQEEYELKEIQESHNTEQTALNTKQQKIYSSPNLRHRVCSSPL